MSQFHCNIDCFRNADYRFTTPCCLVSAKSKRYHIIPQYSHERIVLNGVDWKYSGDLPDNHIWVSSQTTYNDTIISCDGKTLKITVGGYYPTVIVGSQNLTQEQLVLHEFTRLDRFIRRHALTIILLFIAGFYVLFSFIV